MKNLVIILVFISLLSSVSGVRINEIESNPAGTDAGAEWVELFSEQEVDLDKWKLVNNDGDEFELDRTFSGYFVVEFSEQWLDNKDEKVFLYDRNNLIDESELFFDSANNDKTHQFCDSWVFNSGTKGKENDCAGEEKEEEDNEDEKSGEIVLEKVGRVAEADEKETIDLGGSGNVISLNSPATENKEKVVYESKNEKIKKYAVYGFALFLVFVVVVLLVRG